MGQSSQCQIDGGAQGENRRQRHGIQQPGNIPKGECGAQFREDGGENGQAADAGGFLEIGGPHAEEVVGGDGADGGEGKGNCHKERVAEASAEDKPMERDGEKQDVPVESAEGDEQGGQEEKEGAIGCPKRHEKGGNGYQDAFRADIDAPVEERSAGGEKDCLDDFSPGFEKPLPTEKEKERRDREEPEDNHGSAENPEIASEEADEKAEEVDEKRIVRGEGQGVDAVPLCGGMPDARRGPVVRGIEHANLIIPARDVAVGEHNGGEDRAKGNNHGDMERQKENAGKTVEALPNKAQGMPKAGTAQNGETVGSIRVYGGNRVHVRSYSKIPDCATASENGAGQRGTVAQDGSVLEIRGNTRHTQHHWKDMKSRGYC